MEYDSDCPNDGPDCWTKTDHIEMGIDCHIVPLILVFSVESTLKMMSAKVS